MESYFTKEPGDEIDYKLNFEGNEEEEFNLKLKLL